MTNKVYLSIVRKIREIIAEEGYKPGDKLPSERVLTERLQVGRSSVREALRALELLGLIETRRGEGTFLRDFRDHQLVELLGMFILQNTQAQRDVQQTKVFLEQECIRSFCTNVDHASVCDKLRNLQSALNQDEIDGYQVMQQLFAIHPNRLICKIWTILHDFAVNDKGNKEKLEKLEKAKWITILQALIDEDVTLAVKTFNSIKMSITS
ncbi:GntR family transcriptional regulator [Bacillus spongiae]|uniref:GntR family transcriptional regulator n=1 Tax=Bacillus spongiae TaxID=2683610 RepID=A0ABU8H839_9BACI